MFTLILVFLGYLLLLLFFALPVFSALPKCSVFLLFWNFSLAFVLCFCSSGVCSALFLLPEEVLGHSQRSRNGKTYPFLGSWELPKRLFFLILGTPGTALLLERQFVFICIFHCLEVSRRLCQCCFLFFAPPDGQLCFLFREADSAWMFHRPFFATGLRHTPPPRTPSDLPAPSQKEWHCDAQLPSRSHVTTPSDNKTAPTAPRCRWRHTGGPGSTPTVHRCSVAQQEALGHDTEGSTTHTHDS